MSPSYVQVLNFLPLKVTKDQQVYLSSRHILRQSVHVEVYGGPQVGVRFG